MDILRECRDARSVGIGGHVRPDGDCVGACLALYMYLKKNMPDRYVKVFLEKPAEIFREIKGFDQIDISDLDSTAFDVFFCLDCADDRLGKGRKYFEGAAKKINIDHHVSNAGCGTVNCIRPEVGSTCEVLYDLMDGEKIDLEIAKALYIGIIHDTGVFQYSNTTPRTLKCAADLIAWGFDFPKLIQETFYEKTYRQTQIMGRALIESIRFMEGRCIVSCMTREMMEFYGAQVADLEGIVNQLRNIKDVDCAIFMHQTGPLEYKVSLRSDEYVDVAAVAEMFGGGGHVRAAGCTLMGSFHDCINSLSLPISKQLKEHGRC